MQDPNRAISIVEALGHPWQFEGKRIWLSGYLRVEQENTALFLTEEHARLGVFPYSVGVIRGDCISRAGEGERLKTIELEQSDKLYGSVQGVFTQSTGGHMGVHPAVLCEAERVQLAQACDEDCAPDRRNDK